MKQRWSVRNAWGGLVFALMLAGRIFAIDPLPPNLENAPLEDQRRYLDREAQASFELKQKIAQQRFDQRKQFKESILSSLRDEVASQHALLVDPANAAAIPDGVAVPRRSIPYKGLLLASVVLVFIAWQRKRIAGLFEDQPMP